MPRVMVFLFNIIMLRMEELLRTNGSSMVKEWSKILLLLQSECSLPEWYSWKIIRDLWDSAQTMLLYMHHHWPSIIDHQLWAYILRAATNDVFNHATNPKIGKSFIKLFSSVNIVPSAHLPTLLVAHLVFWISIGKLAGRSPKCKLFSRVDANKLMTCWTYPELPEDFWVHNTTWNLMISLKLSSMPNNSL